MNDMISRHAVMNRIENEYRKWGDEYDVPQILGDIEDLPPAEPKTGKWIDETFTPWGLVYHPYKCDQCGEHSETTSNFCPWCGAQMEAEHETD